MLTLWHFFETLIFQQLISINFENPNLKLSIMSDKKWYVLYSKPRWEKKVDAALIRKGIESWCPVNKIEKQWTDRKKNY